MVMKEALEKSIKGSIKYYQIFLVLWIASFGYFAFSKDSYFLIYSLFFFIAAINFNLAQKIDKARLEGLE